MYLIIAVVQNEDAGKLVDMLNSNSIKSTKVASTGGFLGKGNTTLFLAIEKEKKESVVEMIKSVCARRVTYASSQSCVPFDAYSEKSGKYFMEIETGGGVIITIDMENCIRL